MAIGNDAVYVPTLPDFDGFFQDLSKGAKKGGEQAGRDMAAAMEKSLKQSEKQVDSLAKAQERAQSRAADAADKTRVAQMKLSEAMDKSGTSASQLADLTAKYEKAQRDEASSLKASERAASDLAKAKNDLAKKSNEASDAVESGAGNVGDFGDSAKSAAGQVAGLITQLAGIGTIAGGLLAGWDLTKDVARVNNQLGLVGPAAQAVGDEISAVMRTGVVSSSEEAAAAVGSLHSAIGYLGSEGEKSAAELARPLSAFTKTFEADTDEAVQVVSQLLQNDLVGSATEGFDLLTSAYQRVPAAMRDEIPDIVSEYSTFFKSMGFDGQEAFGLIVNAASNGKIEMDKIGDAVKEFSIRATDLGDTGAVEALESIGLAGTDVQNRLLAGGETAQEAFGQVVDSLLDVKDPAAQAEAAVALFGTPLEDLDKTKIPDFLAGMSSAGDAMAGFEGSAEQLAGNIENSLQGRLDALKGTAQSLAADGFMYLWDKGQQLASWAKDNSTWLTPLLVGLGTLAGIIGVAAAAMKTWAVISGIYTTATKIATGQTLLFNTALRTNIIIAVVSALAALVAGLVYFFTQTETGRQAWDSFTGALAAGWDWVVGKIGAGWAWIRDNVWTPLVDWTQGTLLPILSGVWSGIQAGWDGLVNGLQWAWASIIQPVFSAFMTAGKVLFAVLATAVLTPLMIAWNALSAAISWGWQSIIQPTWQLLQTAASFMWNSVLMPVFGWIRAGWELLATGVQWYWQNVIMVAWSALQVAANFMWNSVLMPVFNFISAAWTALSTAIQWYWQNVIMVAWSALQTAAQFMWNAVLMPVFNFITTAWQALGDGIRWVYDSIIKPAWDALGNALTWLYESIIRPTLQWVGDRWNDMSSVLDAGRQFIVDTVFGGLQRGLDVVQDAFQLAKDGIAAAWDGIRAAAAKPVKFVISRIFNDGIVESWNKVADWVGLDPIEKYEPSWLGEFNTGGHVNTVPGYSPGIDDHTFIEPRTGTAIKLSGGEPILRPEAGRVLGTDWVDGINAAARVGGTTGVQRYLGGFNSGGVIGSITGLVNRFYPGMTITSTLRPGDSGHHGSGLAVDFSNGTDSTPQMRSAAQFFYKNYGPALLELIHSPFGNNVKNGQNVGDGFGLYGAGTMNAHRNHVHIAAAAPLPEPGDPITPVPSGGVGGGGVVNWLRNRVADTLDGIFGPIGNVIPEFGGLIGGLPKAAFTKMTGAVSEFIRGKADESGAYYGDVGAGVEQWRPLVEKVLEAKGFSVGLADTTLRRMDQESSGNARAINNWDSNAAAGTPSKGLMQVIDPTFAAFKDPGFDDIWDPEANIRASMNYAMSTYGSLPAAYNRAGGYHAGGLAPAGEGFLHKTAMEPEFVLSPEMTKAFIDWMRGTPQGESAAVVAKELAEAFAGRDWGYGELATYIGENAARRVVNEMSWLGGAADEVTAAWDGIDSGLASVARYLGGNEALARQLLEEVSWAGGAVDEIRAAWTGGDAGYASVARYLGGNEQLARDMLNRLESIGVVSQEISAAYAGGDWGYGELANYIGEDMARETVTVVAATGELVRAVDSWVTTGMDGLTAWARASEDQDRMGTPEEWGRHFGAQAGAEFGAEALGLLGLESLAGHTFRDSLVDLVNEALPFANQGLADHGQEFRFGPMAADMWQPVSVIDDAGRVPGTQLEAVATDPVEIAEPETVDISTPVDTVADSVAASTAQAVDSDVVAAPRELVIQVKGDAVTPEAISKALEEHKGELGDLKIRVEKVEGELDAEVTSGITGIV